MHGTRLVDFSEAEKTMIEQAMDALLAAGYDVALFKELVRVEMPQGFRAMTLADGAALGVEAFESSEWLNHVLEEEYLHLVQKAHGEADEFIKGTALVLELEIDDSRKFPAPDR